MSPLLVIVGETASGKSALAMYLAKEFSVEIICADSWTVYRGFDVGTAKPTKEDQAQVPHHLLDVADPSKGFNAALFQRLAKQAIGDITARGKLPILVGGTGLYIDSILYDYSFLPPSDPELRKELNSLTLEELLVRLKELRLDTTGIDLRNKRRIIRLVENNGVRPTKNAMRENTLVIGVSCSADELQDRITRRIDSMIANGFAEEVRKLGQAYGWNCEPMQAPDYRAFARYVRGMATLDETRRQIYQNDLHLAKKQRTWFKRNHSIQWINDRSYAKDILTTFLNKVS